MYRIMGSGRDYTGQRLLYAKKTTGSDSMEKTFQPEDIQNDDIFYYIKKGARPLCGSVALGCLRGEGRGEAPSLETMFRTSSPAYTQDLLACWRVGMY